MKIDAREYVLVLRPANPPPLTSAPPSASPSATSSRRGSTCCSAASTRVSIRPRPGATSRGQAIASGRRFTPRALRRGAFNHGNAKRCWPAGIGVTNLVRRATVAADELAPAELRAGARRLARKVARFRPRVVAIVGIGAYRTAFDRPRATLGRQEETIGGAMVWVLPNTSGLNANHRPADFTRAFRALRRAAARTTRRRRSGRTSVRSRGTRRRA